MGIAGCFTKRRREKERGREKETEREREREREREGHKDTHSDTDRKTWRGRETHTHREAEGVVIIKWDLQDCIYCGLPLCSYLSHCGWQRGANGSSQNLQAFFHRPTEAYNKPLLPFLTKTHI